MPWLFDTQTGTFVYQLTAAELNLLYLRLDCSNDPLTAALQILVGGGTLTLSPAGITNSSGTIDFSDEILTTTGAVNTNTLTVTSVNASPFVIIRAVDDTTGANFTNKKARLTLGLPAIVQNLDNIGGVIAQAHDGVGYVNAGAARFYASGTIGVNTMPTRYTVSLSPAGSTTLADVFTIVPNGNVTIGSNVSANNPSRLYIAAVATGLSNCLLLSAGNVADAVGDGPIIYFKAASAPAGSLNRAKCMLYYISTGTYGRGDLVFTQDAVADANPVQTSDTEVIRLKNNGDITIPRDNGNVIFGAGGDASVYYDGTDMKINPKVVGTGKLDVTGVLQTDGYNSSDASAGISQVVTILDGDAVSTHTLTFKDGLLTAYTKV